MTDLFDDYVTTTEAAQLIEKGARIVARLCQDGKLPGAKKIAKTWLIPRESVLTYKPERGRPKTKKQCLAAERAEYLEQSKEEI